MSQLKTDEDSQRNGWVAIVYNVGPYHLEYFDRELYSRYLKVLKVLPFRIVGYHSCFNDLKLRTVTPFTLLLMGKETRARYRSHVGKSHGTHLHLDQASCSGLTIVIRVTRWMPIRNDDVRDTSPTPPSFNGWSIWLQSSFSLDWENAGNRIDFVKIKRLYRCWYRGVLRLSTFQWNQLKRNSRFNET